MIPNTIHYCWFGRNKKSALIERCIASWGKYLPECEIIEWNEENFDVTQNEYIREAYKAKKWAYVSDYARMKVLYEYGGIYFDTDVELLRSLPEKLWGLPSFSGIESFSKLVSPGLIYACEKKDKLVGEVLASYEADVFVNTKIENMKTINVRITEILDKYGYVHEDKEQVVSGLVIFPSEIFCAYNGKKRKIEPTFDTISVHHYTASWLPWHRKVRKFFGTVYRRVRYRR